VRTGPNWPDGNPTPIQASLDDYVYIYPGTFAKQAGFRGALKIEINIEMPGETDKV
jgi:hypothetical protein